MRYDKGGKTKESGEGGKKKIQIFQSMIYRAIERSLARKKCVCAASLKPDKDANSTRELHSALHPAS